MSDGKNAATDFNIGLYISLFPCVKEILVPSFAGNCFSQFLMFNCTRLLSISPK